MDPLVSAALDWNPYHGFNDNPINNVDPTGKFSINNHYNITYDALKKMGASKVASDLIAHYSSVFADHPAKWITWAQRNYYRDGYEYSKTSQSQNTASKESSTFHAMTADGEKISNVDAKARGQAFGWSKILEAGSSMILGLDGVKKNSKTIEDLGQGLHALQDAEAHNGVNMDNHDLINDMYPSTKDYQKAEEMTQSALIVADIMSGHNGRLRDGMKINLTGTTVEQFNLIKSKIQDGVNAYAKEGVKMNIILTGKPKEKK